MEAICLDVTVQQVSPGWGGGFKTSHPAERKKKIQHHRLNIRNVHHTRSLSQHTRHNKPVFTLIPARVRAALFALSLARGGHPRRKENAEAEGELVKENGRNNRGHHRYTAPRLFWFECHRVEFPPPHHYSRQTPELHLCLECFCFCTGSCTRTGLFCKGSSLIITVNMLLHTFLHPLGFCANNVAAQAGSVEAPGWLPCLCQRGPIGCWPRVVWS